eukprot:2562652-Pleurochrysis_carterae.AAC.5
MTILQNFSDREPASHCPQCLLLRSSRREHAKKASRTSSKSLEVGAKVAEALTSPLVPNLWLQIGRNHSARNEDNENLHHTM